jgi:hypothetical protein
MFIYQYRHSLTWNVKSKIPNVRRGKENSKKQMPSEIQKTFLEDSDREIREIIDGNRIKFEVHDTKILDLMKNGQQGEIVKLEYPKDSGQFKKRARFLARDLTSLYPQKEKEWTPPSKVAQKV